MKQFYLFTLILIVFSTIGFSQSKLEKAQESLKKEERSISNSSGDEAVNDDDDDDGFGRLLFEETIGRLFVNIFLYASYYSLIESPAEENKAVLTRYPYYYSNKGNYSYEWDESSVIGRTTITSTYISENSKIKGNHLNFDFRFYNKLGLEVDYLQLWENNPNFGHHTFAIYSALAKYHRIRTERFNAWWGLGASYFDGSVNELGFTYGLGTQVFLGKPISIESTFNQTLINSETLNKFKAILNYHINQYKLIGGYEHLKIGSEKFATLALGIGVSF